MRKKILAAVVILFIVIAGILIWAVQPNPTDGGDGGSLGYICDVTLDLHATYSDFALTYDQVKSHTISNWGVTTSTSNWRQEQNLNLFTIQGQAFVEYAHRLYLLAAFPGHYRVDLSVAFLQKGKTVLTTGHSFIVEMPQDWGVLPFEESWTITGVKAGTYTIQITILSGQYISGSAGDRSYTFQFDATFTSP